MKKTILFSLLFGLMMNLQAQVDYYTLTRQGYSTYPEPSSSATSLWTSGDDEEQTGVPIGFDFYYGGRKYSTCTVGVNGAISFTETQIFGTGNDLASTNAGRINIIGPVWDDLKLFASNNGFIKYETSGSAPNRVFKVYWKNISHYNDDSSTMSFVLELKETSNEIEFYYGHCNTGVNLSASIGFNFNDGTNTTFVSVATTGSNPTTSRSTANNNISAADWPGNGYRYTFEFQHAYNDWDFNARPVTLADPRDNSSIVINYANNVGATNSHGTEPTCAGFNGGDVWYKFTAPTTGAISIIRTEIGGFGDLGYALYHNGQQTPVIYCNSIIGGTSHLNEPNMVGGLTAGDTYYIRMWDYNNNNFGITPFYVAKVEPNDEAAYAININVQPEDASMFLMTTANNTFAMNSEHINGDPACNGFNGGDVWYKFTVPSNGDGTVKVYHSGTAGDWSSFAFAVYNSPTATTPIDCQVIYISGNTAPYAIKTITGLTGGQDYWLRTWDFYNNDVGTSQFYLTDDALGVEDYQQLSFKFYPNPATDVLNVSAASNIDMISITNLLGQEVRRIAPNQKQTVLNIADLQNGVYLMKVQTGDKVSTVKFIKK